MSKKMTKHQICTRSCSVLFTLVLTWIILFPAPVQAATTLTVTVTASPQSLALGESTALQVAVTMSGNPVPGAEIALTGAGASGSFASASGTTNSAGIFSTTLTTSPSAMGTIHVTADASYTPFIFTVKPETSYGTGFADITVVPPTVQQPGDIPPLPGGTIPVASIIIDRNSGDIPLAIRFDGKGSYDPDGSVNGYFWSFGDGATGRGYVVYHTYSTPSFYTATLTVTDNEGLQSLPVSVIISARENGAQAPDTTGLLTAVIEVNRSYGPAPLAVAFDGSKSTGPSGNVKDYFWDFGDGSTAHGPFTYHTYPEPGSYDTRLTVTGTGNLPSEYSMIQIIVKSSSPAPGSTNAPGTTTPLTPVVSAGPASNNDLQNSEADSGSKNPPLPYRPLVPRDFSPFAGVMSGILIGAAAMAITKDKPRNPEGKKFQEFSKIVLGRKGANLAAVWESKRQKINVIRRKEIIAGLSIVEILVAATSAVLIGTAFYIARPNPDQFLFTLVVFIAMSGAIIVLHDLLRRWVARRHGQYGEYRIWPLGTLLMFLTAVLFGWICGKPSRPVFETGKQKNSREVAMECLAGPAFSCVLAGLFLILLPLGGIATTVGTAAISINILLALYSLMPFEPMDGLKVWAWNKVAYVVIFIPLLVTYIGIAYIFT